MSMITNGHISKINLVMKHFIAYLIAAFFAVLTLGSCEKFPDGQGELVVVMYNSEGWTNLEVFPYTPEYVPGMEPVATAELSDGSNEIAFTLNAGNYSVFYGNSADLKAAQVVAGESVTVRF